MNAPENKAPYDELIFQDITPLLSHRQMPPAPMILLVMKLTLNN